MFYTIEHIEIRLTVSNLYIRNLLINTLKNKALYCERTIKKLNTLFDNKSIIETLAHDKEDASNLMVPCRKQYNPGILNSTIYKLLPYVTMIQANQVVRSHSIV